jgi:thiol-disulfide isomerase/thioredoxin
MKKICLLLCTIYACAGGYAQATKLTIVRGVVNKDNQRPMMLFSVKEGEKIAYASTHLDNKNNFAFAIPNCEEGFYYLTDTVKMEFTRIYLKPGENLELSLEENNKYEINAGSQENKLMNEWNKLAYTVEKATILGDTSTFRFFFPAYEALLPKAADFKKKIATSNAKFNRLLKYTVDFDMNKWAVRFLLIPHSEHPKKEDYPDFYKKIAASDIFSNTYVLQNGDAADFMATYITFKMLLMSEAPKAQTTKIDRLKQSLSYISNDTLKGIYLANSLGQYRTYEDLTNTTDSFKHYIITSVGKEKYFNALRLVSTFKKGTPGYNFQYPDTKNNLVSLKSLKGKVVVIDIWATWCAPCKAEIPHLQKLEEEMKNNPEVEFVSISVDEEKDKEKWLDFVKEKSLGGTQLYAKGWSDIVKFYKITGIPRFMVFDQKGDIVSVDAPRPSTPELKKMIDATLAENKTATAIQSK